VNRWLLRAPLWAVAAVCGIPIAVFLALLLRYGRHQSWMQALIAAVICGVAGGLLTASSSRRQMAGSRTAIGDAPDSVRDRVASRPTARGPVPADPEERAATLRLLDSQIAELRRRRVGTFALFPAAMALFAWFALARSPWWWLLVALLAASLVLVLRAPAMLERRAERLRQASGDD
jgi:hypothetical protein